MIDKGVEKTVGQKVLDYLKQLFGGTPTQPTEETGFLVEKGLDGKYRWFAWVSNKWEDREGEILTDSAHKEYIAFLDANPGFAPELWLWHTPGTAHENKADWWEYKNGFLMFSGVLTDEEAKPYVNKTITPEPMGVSHGFYKYGGYGRYITKYRTFEISPLPLDRAANSHTGFNLLMEEEMDKGFDPRRRQFLVERLGEEKVATIETATENREKVLQELGVDWKELNEQYEAEIAEEKAVAAEKAAKPIVEEVVEGVVKAMNLEGLQAVLKSMNDRLEVVPALEAKLAELEAEVTALKQLDDERITKMFAPIEPMAWDLSVTAEEKAVAAEQTAEEIVEKASQEGFQWLANLNPLGGK